MTTKKVLKYKILFPLFSLIFLFLSFSSFVYASSDFDAEMEGRKSLPVDSNSWTEWPSGPLLGAEAAILIEANSNTILYSKNCDERLFPASTTKMLTAILIMENCQLDDTVTFSKNAIESISLNDSNMEASIGDTISVEQALEGILIGSANEAAYAMAEFISGDINSFAKLMNKKAAELGCTNTHFVTPNGLHDENHYTSAHDLALIAREFFKYDNLCRLSSTYSCEIVPQGKTEPTILYTKNKLLPGKAYAYPYLVGSKTGFTTEARQTLVSCAQKDGMSLICVILKEENPYQFEDTISLFDFGFSNFKNINISENELSYNFNFTDTFSATPTLFGNENPVMSLEENAYVTIPISASFSDLTSQISPLDTSNDTNSATNNKIAFSLSYFYNTNLVGFSTLKQNTFPSLTKVNTSSPFYEKDTALLTDATIIYINLRSILFCIGGLFIPLYILLCLKAIIFNGPSFKYRKSLKKRKSNSSSPYKNIRF